MNKKLFIVTTEEKYISHYAIKADTDSEAKDIVRKEPDVIGYAFSVPVTNITTNVTMVTEDEYIKSFDFYNHNTTDFTRSEKLQQIFEVENDPVLERFVDVLKRAIDTKKGLPEPNSKEEWMIMLKALAVEAERLKVMAVDLIPAGTTTVSESPCWVPGAVYRNQHLMAGRDFWID